MHHNLLNKFTKFQGSICKTLDVTNEKPILIARFTKCRANYKWEKIHLHLIHLRFGIFQKFFLDRWIKISVVHSPGKDHWSISKIKGTGREKLILIAKYKILFYF